MARSILRYLITGGAGFLGSHLSKKLLNNGHEVLVADNFYTGKKANIQELLENHRGIVSGTLTSASALSKESRDKIIDNLSKSITGKLQLTEMVDANLIGGFVVRIGDNQIDASVATQLRKLKQELTQ